jgi:tripartite-type tricarboxylate transporter receptor subunit TctC
VKFKILDDLLPWPAAFNSRERLMFKIVRRLLLSISLLAFVAPAAAQNWPNRPLRVIVSQAAGGTPDIICRLVMEPLSRALGQQIIVENRPGGGNVIGAQAAARAAPDGYTLFFATAAALVTNPYTFKSLPYDPQKDFVPVSMVAQGVFLVLANPNVPAKSLGEVFALAKAEPGKLSFATDGPKNFSGMIAAWLNKLGGTQIQQVPYSTMPQGIQDTIAGRVQLTVLAVPSAAGAVASGTLRPLAVTSSQRIPGYENVATVAETFPGFHFTGWMVLVAPTGTPPDAVQKVNREMQTILNDPSIVKRLRDIGFFSDGAGTPETTGRFIRTQYDAWGKVVREIGLQPE